MPTPGSRAYDRGLIAGLVAGVIAFTVPADVATFRLDRGATVVVAPRAGSPVVAIQAWIGAGSADEPAGQAGIAHVVEHMLFKGTARRAVGEVTSAIERAGGDVNAWTSFDQTVLHAVLGRGDLALGLEVVADAIARSTFDEDELAREREVIVEEIRQGADDPARAAAHALFGASYVIHPYRRPVIGTEASVRALGRDALVGFHRSQYVGDNLTLVVAGDVEPRQVRALAERELADLPVGAPRRLRAAEPAQVAPRAVVATHAVAEAQLAIGFRAPPVRSPDTPLLDLAAVALGQGESSRLAALRGRAAVVSSVVAHLHALRDPGLFVVSATAPVAGVDEALAAIVGAIVRGGADLDARELERARGAVMAEQVWQQETAEGIARKLGWHQVVAGDVGWEREYLERVERATVEEVREAVARYVRVEKATAAVVVPRARKAERLVAAMARGAKPRTRRSGTGTGTGTGTGKRVVLDNGVRVIVWPEPSVGVVAMRAVWPGGTRLETDATSGTTALLASVITRGCGERDGDAFATEVDRLAGGIVGVGGRNSFGVRAEWLARDWERGLGLLADCVLAPRFEPAEVERQRRLLLDDLAARADSGSHQAFRLFAETLYGRHPYHLDPLGSPDAVSDLTPKKLARFYRDHFPASAMTLAIVGDVDPDAVIAAVRARFGDVPAREPAAPSVRAAAFDGKSAAEREVYRYLAREQAHLVIGFPGTTVTSKDRFAVEVLATILGGQSGRLFAELRERQALAYRVSAFAVDGLDPGYVAIYVSCAPDKVGAAVAAIRGEIDRLVRDGVDDEEVARAVQYLTGAHAVAMQRRSAIANAIAFHDAYGLGWRSWQRYGEDVAKVDAAAVAKAARAYLDWDRAVTATVRPPGETRGAEKRRRPRS